MLHMVRRMRSLSIVFFAVVVAVGPPGSGAEALQNGFVYLRDVAPTIHQDIRYFGRHNFIGRPIAGYLAPECIITAKAAYALAGVQAELAPSNLSLVVYDC